MDRTLDLFGPASYQSDTLADQILSILSHHRRSNSDVSIDMSPVIKSDEISGRLAQPRDDKAQQLLKSLVYGRKKVIGVFPFFFLFFFFWFVFLYI